MSECHACSGGGAKERKERRVRGLGVGGKDEKRKNVDKKERGLA